MMLSSCFLILLFATAAMLLVSGVGKLRKPGTLEELETLGVPQALRLPILVRVHPWAEIVLGAGLLVTRGWLLVLLALASLALLVGYTVLVARAVRRNSAATCNCFGAFFDPRLTRRSVMRNVVWSVSALGTVLGAAAGWSVLGTVGAQPATLLPVLATALVAVAVWATVSVPATDRAEPVAASSVSVGEEELADYIRTPTPLVWLRDAEGERHTVRDLARRQARLLLFLRPGCGPCKEIANQVPGWAEEFAMLGVHPVFHVDQQVVEVSHPDLASCALYEEGMDASRVFDVQGYPTAVLLGVDDLLAGGPVRGALSIRQMIDDLRGELPGAGEER